MGEDVSLHHDRHEGERDTRSAQRHPPEGCASVPNQGHRGRNRHSDRTESLVLSLITSDSFLYRMP